MVKFQGLFVGGWSLWLSLLKETRSSVIEEEEENILHMSILDITASIYMKLNNLWISLSTCQRQSRKK